MRMVSSPVSLSRCKRDHQFPVLGQPAAAGDRYEETVVYEPLGAYGELGRGRLSRQPKHRLLFCFWHSQMRRVGEAHPQEDRAVTGT